MPGENEGGNGHALRRLAIYGQMDTRNKNVRWMRLDSHDSRGNICQGFTSTTSALIYTYNTGTDRNHRRASFQNLFL